MPANKDQATGKWTSQFYYTDWTGERKKKKKRGFETKKEALAWEREFLEKQQGSPDITMKSLIELYLEDMGTRLRKSTMDGKQYIFKDKIIPYFGNKQINQIKPTDIRKWQNALIKKGYAETYLKTINNQLTAIFNYAMRYYNLRDNPCHKAGSIGKSHAEEMNFWIKEEFDKFIVHVSDKPQSKTAFEILYWTGIRIGELMALTIKDINFDNNTIDINKSIQRIKGEDIITAPKTPKSKRIVPITEYLTGIIKEYIEHLYDKKSNDRLFLFTKHYLQKEMARGCKKSGVKHIRTHDLRHSHASLLIELGFTPLLIAERLGHEKIETTLNTYSHLYPNKQEQVVGALQKLQIEPK